MSIIYWRGVNKKLVFFPPLGILTNTASILQSPPMTHQSILLKTVHLVLNLQNFHQHYHSLSYVYTFSSVSVSEKGSHLQINSFPDINSADFYSLPAPAWVKRDSPQSCSLTFFYLLEFKLPAFLLLPLYLQSSYLIEKWPSNLIV